MIVTILTILPVFLIIAAGYALARTGILGEGATQALNRFVIWLALPCLMFDIVATTDWARLWHPGFVAVSLIGTFAVYALGLVIGRMRGLSLQDMVVDGLNASYANTAYIGLPLLALVLGPAARPFVAIGATLTLMVLFMTAVLMMELGRSHGHGVGHALRRALAGVVRNPILVGSILGLAWWLSGLHLPVPAKTFVSLLGGAASPTALVAIGVFLAGRPLRESAANRSVVMLSVTKLVLHPAVTAVFAWYVFALPPFIATCAIALAAMPTGTGPFMIAEFYARDGRVTSGAILVTTLLSVLTIAGVISLLPH